MIGNFEATQFIIERIGKDLEFATIKRENDGPLTEISENMFAQGVKWFFLCNADGKMGVSVFLISDDKMDPEKYLPIKVPGLTHSNDMGAYGYLGI